MGTPAPVVIPDPRDKKLTATVIVEGLAKIPEGLEQFGPRVRVTTTFQTGTASTVAFLFNLAKEMAEKKNMDPAFISLKILEGTL